MSAAFIASMANMPDTDSIVVSLLKVYKTYDPAARSSVEVFLLYPGFKAQIFYRIARYLFVRRVPFVPRLISEIARFLTGIEIHPGAEIGHSLVIDHGMGVVIGETAVVGNHVLIYQGVTLGGTSLHKIKRHPTIGDRVVLGAGCKVLGDITVGEGSRVGANSVVIENVPAECTVVGIPAKIIRRGVQPGEELNHDFII